MLTREAKIAKQINDTKYFDLISIMQALDTPRVFEIIGLLADELKDRRITGKLEDN